MDDDVSRNHYSEEFDRWMKATEEADEEAESTLPAIYLLLPTAADAAHEYLNACREARTDPGEGRPRREHLRKLTEELVTGELTKEPPSAVRRLVHALRRS